MILLTRLCTDRSGKAIPRLPTADQLRRVTRAFQHPRRFAMDNMAIGQMARAAGAGVETIRFYEREGLLEHPARSASGYRKYPPEAVARLRLIRQAKELGFSLNEIKKLFALRVAPGKSCSDVRARAERKIADIDQRIAALDREGRNRA